MEVDTIDQLPQFENLKSSWDSVYAADPHAQVFVSWAWLRGWLEITPNDWFVLAARRGTDGPYVAFFPLALRPVRVRGIGLMRELHMGGKPFAAYTGFLSLPEHETTAICAFAHFVQRQLNWEELHLAEVLDKRVHLFLQCFSPRRFDVRQLGRVSCPYVPLPNSWDEYLQRSLSKRGRFKLRRSIRSVEGLNGFHTIEAERETIGGQIETLLALWEARWGQATEEIRNRYRHMYRHAFSNDLLWLKVLKNGESPISAAACFVDPIKGSYCLYSAVYNPEYAALSPGKAVCGYGIRDAIRAGFKVFDFSLGAHDYKFHFGSKERFTSSTILLRRSFRRTAGRLLLRSRDLLRKRRPQLQQS